MDIAVGEARPVCEEHPFASAESGPGAVWKIGLEIDGRVFWTSSFCSHDSKESCDLAAEYRDTLVALINIGRDTLLSRAASKEG